VGYRLGHGVFFDWFTDASETVSGPPERVGKLTMGYTAENVAELYKLTRKDLDEFAVLSQKKGVAAIAAGVAETVLPAGQSPRPLPNSPRRGSPPLTQSRKGTPASGHCQAPLSATGHPPGFRYHSASTDDLCRRQNAAPLSFLCGKHPPLEALVEP
jgi:hypothetical protein